MIDLLGWISTGLVLLGYVYNARQLTMYAMIAWIIGDTGWIVCNYSSISTNQS